MARMIFDDAMWERLRPLLPKGHKGGRPGADDRLFLEGVSWIYRTGSPWRDLPVVYGRWHSVYNRFHNWNRNGYMETILKGFNKNGDHEWHMIDSTIVKAHQHSAGAPKSRGEQLIGKSVAGNSTKIHAKVDSLGLPLKLILTRGQEHDSKSATDLCDSVCDYILADKGSDTNELRNHLADCGIQAVIPGKRNRIDPIVYDKEIYKERNAVERFFCKIKDFRRIATRYDKLDIMFMGGLCFIAVAAWLRV